MSINEIRDQCTVVRDRLKLAHFHAEALKNNPEDVERCKFLVRESKRCLEESEKLLKLAIEYEAINKN